MFLIDKKRTNAHFEGKKSNQNKKRCKGKN